MNRRILPFLFLALWGLLAATGAPAPIPRNGVAGGWGRNGVGQPSPEQDEISVFIAEQTQDRFERVNRGIFWFNHRLLLRILVYPARLYRRVTPHALRQGVENFATNLTGPRRIVNNLFQDAWGEAGSESKRFLINTTVGVIGLFDPATHWLEMPLYNEDFGQTVGHWGAGPGPPLEAPVLGPSDPRDLLATPVDWAMDPLTYFPGASIAARFNELSMNLAEYEGALHSVNDPYLLFTDGFRLMREAQVRDVVPAPASPDDPPDEPQLTPQDREVADSAMVLQGFPPAGPYISSMYALHLKTHDRNFFLRGRDRRVRLTSTGRRFTYRLWKHDGSHPILFFLPGLGEHYTSPAVTTFAEVFYDQGFDVVAIPSTFHRDFSREASTAPLPGDVEVDARDCHTAMLDILNQLRGRYACAPDTPVIVAGESIGGLHTLFISEIDRRAEQPEFAGFLALNPVVDLCHATRNLDHLFDDPAILRRPGEEDALHDALLRVAQFVEATGDEPNGRPAPPLRSEDAAFAMGFYFRLQLADVIFDSQQRHDLGVLQTPLNPHRRAPSYREIMHIGFEDYVRDFIGSYVGQRDFEVLCAQGALRAIQSGLSENPRVRVIHSADDFLLGPGDLTFLRDTFRDRLVLFNTGGHCGNYPLPQVQQAVRDATSSLLEQAGLPSGAGHDSISDVR